MCGNAHNGVNKKMVFRRRFYRRGFDYDRGYDLGYGTRFEKRYASNGDPTKCARFPDLRRGWWANPAYEGATVQPVSSVDSERVYLEGSIKGLEQELADIKNRLAELSTTEISE